MAGYGTAPHNYLPEIAKSGQLIVSPMSTNLLVASIPLMVALETEEVTAGLYDILQAMRIFAMYFACLGFCVPGTLLGSVGAFQDPAKVEPEQYHSLTRSLKDPYLFQNDSWLCR